MAAGLVVGAAAAAVGAVGNTLSTNMQINETIAENEEGVSELEAQSKASALSARGRMGVQSESNKYDAAMAAITARTQLGSSKAKSGYSGVRGVSPLLALKQQEDLGNAAVAEQIQRGNSALTQQGLEASLLTEEYTRKVNKLNADTKYMKDNRWKYLGLSALGGVAQIGGSVAGKL